MKKHQKEMIIKVNDRIELVPVTILNTGFISRRGVADGRTLPSVIINCSNRPDIKNAIEAHRHFSPGDVESSWRKPDRASQDMVLILNLLRSHPCVIVLAFDVNEDGALVDRIIGEQGLYIQCGKQGDKLGATLECARMLVEVPSQYIKREWEKHWRRVLTKYFKKRGSNRSNAKKKAEEVIALSRATIPSRLFGRE